ncbi:SGNH/GDSL hydrolase family protein [Paenibacillus oceani]|uniref:SGNH/GDSL hydrolase family protein n=1 Tax=Paenibacillus oceani TaxID=2772510 RepID=A0A927CA72_9BACL|nr:SGNH/GDSL hydrolase family protein [Paenibacillus oceani]MBD2862551.1 SGNH/GDSL hydrolase family protein [Paenibacillus oceani]
MKIANHTIAPADALIVFSGDSHTAGQGASALGDDRVPGLPAPAGVTDRFHQRFPSSGVWLDQFSRFVRDRTGLSMTQFVNAGRGNHTMMDYIGEPFDAGACQDGDKDCTDHLAEVLRLNPTLIILEPMIINDWFHGVPLSDTRSAFTRMIRRILAAGPDVIVIGPAPVITESTPFDYKQHPEFLTKPPLPDNVRGQGRYEDYYDIIQSVCLQHQIFFLHTVDYFQYRFRRVDHRNWTTGVDAGRIHVNQHGHDLYYEALLQTVSDYG